MWEIVLVGINSLTSVAKAHMLSREPWSLWRRERGSLLVASEGACLWGTEPGPQRTHREGIRGSAWSGRKVRQHQDEWRPRGLPLRGT